MVTPRASNDQEWPLPFRSVAPILYILVLFLCFGPGCESSPQRAPDGVSIGVLRAEGAVYRTRSVETLQRIARDRGFDLIVLESLNSRWRGIEIPPGSEIRLPVGKPKIRRIRQGSEGTR